jgi:uncharacterized membrane protein
MLVVVFDDEGKAYEGTRALQELHREGSIGVYGAAVIARDSAGVVSVKEEADEGPIGAAVGMMTGALIGMIGGPQTMALGAASGTVFGSMFDLNNLGVGLDYMQEVGEQLEPGKVAVVAEIDEEWVTPVDSRMESLGGTVIRRERIDVEDAQIERDIAAAEAELVAMKEEYSQAVGEAKEKMKAKVDKAEAKLSAAKERAKAKAEAAEQETKAKLQSFEDRMAAASAETKAKFHQRVAKIKADHNQRMDKLKGLWA